MFCVECGKEPEELHDGLCSECYSKRLQATIPEHLDIEVCTSCWSVRQGSQWKERPDMYAIMLERVDGAISISPEVDRYAFRAEFTEEDPRNIMADIAVELFSGDIKVERELNSKIILKKEQCTTCSRIHGNYYEAILQVRPSLRELTEEQKKEVKKMVHREIEDRRGGDRSIFITSEEEMHGGLDYYLSDNAVAKKLSKDISQHFGGKVTTSSKLAGRKDGRNIYKMTYSVRVPPYERGDFLRFKDELYRIPEIRTSSGHVTLQHVGSGKKISVERREVEDVDVLGGREMIDEAVVVSETEDEIKVLDPETYLTKTLVKPEGFTRQGDHAKIIKYSGRIFLVTEEES